MQGLFIRTTILASILIASSILQTGFALADHDMAHEQLPTSWKADAELTDVFFLDANLGWAVGAQGVIVRTIDGGKTWNEISQVVELVANGLPLDQKIRNMRNGVRSRSTGIANNSSAHQPVRCRFESIHFVDEKYGWIAGGYDVPYIGRSRAVVMRTQDGGVTWEAIENLMVPRINRIHFSDPINGWAVGETGNLFQAGIFYTSDGGRSWSSQSSEKLKPWADGEQTGNGFVTLSTKGRIGVIKAGSYEASVVLQDDGSRITQLAMADGQTGWAVGENGTLVQTENGGMSWSPVETPQIDKLIKAFDLETLSITEKNIWFAGDPGSFLFSVDRSTGETKASRTPISSRINKIHFVDDQIGWAVGSFGVIMATLDGGQTWKIQRGASRSGSSRKTAILCVAADDQSLPFEILSKYATEEGRICASLILSGSNHENQAAIQATERLGSAMSIAIDAHSTGTSVVDPIEHRNRVMEKVVRTIRTLQPNVVVCNSRYASSSENAALSADPVTLLQDAIRAAADRNAFSNQLNDLGLKSWQVSRLAILDPTGTVSIDPRRLLPRTGVLIEDQISVSRALVGLPVVGDEPPKYRVSHLTNRNRMKGSDLVSGLGSSESIPSRDSANAKRGNLNMIQQANAKHKKFKQFVQFEANTPRDLLVWRQQVQSFAMTMEKDVAGVWLMQLADRYLAAGKTELAANATSLLVTHWPDHAFAPAGLTWLAQYYASDEFGQIEFLKRVKSGQLQRNGEQTKAERIKNQFATTPQTVQHNGVSHLVWTPTQSLTEEGDANELEPEIAQASNDESVAQRPALFDERLKLASHFLSQLGQRDPELAAGPQYKFLEAQLSRRINGVLANEGRFKSLVQKREFNGAGISVGAQRELGLHHLLPSNAGRIESFVCQKTQQRPRLDGTLDEPFWQTAIERGNLVLETVHLPGIAESSSADAVVFAYDDQFLYAGFHCHKIQGQHYNARNQARPRDGDLSRRDRVELVIDLDRDYRSTNRFVIDHRGWVNESCTGSLGWNPDWYVSQSEDESTWTVEVAIPLEQILPGQIEHDTTWAFQVARRAYHPTNLWDKPVAGTIEPQTNPTGLQLGLVSRPAKFELMRFVDDAEVAETQ